jgi:hypothetical protein
VVAGVTAAFGRLRRVVAGVAVRTKEGAAVEAIYRHRGGEALQPHSMFDAWPVAVDRAGASPVFWHTGCELYGYVPESFGPAVWVEPVLAGDVQPRERLGGIVYAFGRRTCTSEAEVKRLEGTIEVRRYDADGKRIWTGRPEEGFDPFMRLDVPPTKGESVD